MPELVYSFDKVHIVSIVMQLVHCVRLIGKRITRLQLTIRQQINNECRYIRDILKYFKPNSA